MSHKEPWVPLSGLNPNYSQYTHSEEYSFQGLDQRGYDYPLAGEVQLDEGGTGYLRLNQQPRFAPFGPSASPSSSSPSSNAEGSLGTNQDSTSDSSLSNSWVLEGVLNSSSYAPSSLIYPPEFDYNDVYVWGQASNQPDSTNLGLQHDEVLESISTSRKEALGDIKTESHESEELRCSWCNAQMSRSADLRRHELIHLETKPFVCGDCFNVGKHKAFGRKDHLTQHMRKAHDLPEHQKPAASCSICSVVPEEQQLFFATKTSYVTHINRSHNSQSMIENDVKAAENSTEFQDKVTAINGNNRKQLCAAKRAIRPPSPSATRQAKHKRLGINGSDIALLSSNAGARPKATTDVPVGINRNRGRQDLRPRSNPRLQRIFSQAPSPLPANDSHGIFVRNLVCEYEIIRMEPVEFLALSKFQDFRTAEEREGKFMNLSGTSSIPVVYNVAGSVLKLRGNVLSIETLKKLVLSFLEDLRTRTQHKLFSTKSTDTLCAPRTSFRLNAKTPTGSSNGTNVRVFPVRAKEEKLIISFWSETLARQLPEILSPRIGKKYSAGLVRQGSSSLTAKVTLRIQSPNGQSKGTREDIQEVVDQICRENHRDALPVHFSTGHVTPLAHVEGAGHIDNERSEEATEFPHFKRYWEKSGMGVSIGPRGCNRVTATLGGFICIDDKIFALSVDHFISESLDRNAGSGTADPLPHLTSPSLSDVQQMRGDLEQTLRDMGVTIKRCMRALTDTPDADISLPRIDEDAALQEHEKQTQRYIIYLAELTKPDDHFLWGKVEYRSPEPTRRLSPDFARRMDWSLSKVNENRLGENRHRYRFDIACPGAEDIRDENFPLGTGHPCRETCAVEPNASVLYFGQRDGYQRAKVSAAQTIVACEDDWTFEWVIISDAIQGFDCAGDSGAWVVDNRMRVVGMVWGWCDIGLAFTPINEIFDDIRDQLQLDTPPRIPDIPAEPGSSPIPIVPSPSRATPACGIKEPAQRKARSYRFTIPILGGPKWSSSSNVSVPSTDDGGSEDGSQITQTPSLTLSTITTPGTSPEVPRPLTPVDEGPEPLLMVEGSDRQGAPKPSNINKIEVLKACEALQKNVQHEMERRQQLPDKKHSIPFILGDASHSPPRPASNMEIAA